MEEAAESAAIGLGPTFLLIRGGTDGSTEGVSAPACLLELGIGSMMDLADAFSDDEEVRSAIGAADQTAQDLPVQAWQQCRRRAPIDYFHRDISEHTDIGSAEACQTLCQTVEACIVFSWQPSTRDCWLKMSDEGMRTQQMVCQGLDRVQLPH